MKVLFANPPIFENENGVLRKWVRAGSRWPHSYPAISRPDVYAEGNYVPYPFFMGYAATYLAKHTGVEVRLRDSVALHEGYASFWRYLQAEQPNIIFFESASPSWEHDKKLIQRIPEFLPGAKIVVCGPITSLQGKEILETLPVIACLKGEYEKNAVKVINGATGLLEHDLLTTAEMNASPFPYYDHATYWKYFDGCPPTPNLPHAHVWASRGCPFSCVFCVWPGVMTGNDPDGQHTRKVRFYSADYMLAFLQELVAKYRLRSIYFDDDTFNLGNKHTIEMCGVMRKIGLPWAAMCRADTSTRDTWKEMRDSGCYGVKVGIESGSQYVVDKIVNKGLNLEEARATVIYLRSLGMSVHGTFTYGLPGETAEQMKETKAFIAKTPFSTIQESGTAEIEGTPLHTLRERGHLDAYPGASLDGFSGESDGVKKFQSIKHELSQL